MIAAVTGSHREFVILLLENEVNVNYQQHGIGATALIFAIYSKDYGMCELLLDSGANPNIPLDNSPLEIAAGLNYTDILTLILSYPQTDPDQQDQNGYTALQTAARGGKADAARILLEAGANPNISDNEGVTPLMIAVSRNSLHVVTVLLDYSADVNAQNNNGFTALMYSLTREALPILLNVDSIDLDITDNQGQTALMKAVLDYLDRSVGLLLEAGADPLIKDNQDLIASDLTNNNFRKRILRDYEKEYRERFNVAKDALFKKLLAASRLKFELAERQIPENIVKRAEYDRLCVILKRNTGPELQALATSLRIPLGNKSKDVLCKEITEKLKF